VIAVSDADARLVLRCQANDAAAFNEIVARYQNKVYNYICHMVGAGAEAEDLAQETFVRAYLSIHSFQSRASLNTWLFRIATNLCIDYLRRHKKTKALTTLLHREGSEEAALQERELPDERFEPQRNLLSKELAEHLDRALQSLPEKLRTVMLLYDVEGLSYEEIAQIVDCPLGTVKSRLFHARAGLRAKLSPYLDERWS
jgi:RNA polymerase sigma-70 factor (ECF subfamily)